MNSNSSIVQQKLILLVEDNPAHQLLTRRMLEKLGYEYDAVSSGEEALEIIKKKDFQLILMDCLLPGISGFETAAIIREGKIKPSEEFVIIAITTLSDSDDRQRCIASGMNDYLQKPVRPDELAARLKHWLSQPFCTDKNVEPVEEYSLRVFDKNGYLERMMDDIEIAREIALAFIKDMYEQIEALKEAQMNGDMKQGKRRSHSIKGGSAFAGGEILSSIAKILEEEFCKGVSGSEINDALVTAQIERLLPEMQRLESAIYKGLKIGEVRGEK